MALSTVKISAKVEDSFTTGVQCSHPFIVDQPKSGGGNDQGPNPLELFLSSLGACICAIGRIIANQQKIKLRKLEAEVEGDLNKDFLLGQTTQGRAGFEEIRSYITIDADITEEDKKAFVNEIAKRCPIADNILNTSAIKVFVK